MAHEVPLEEIYVGVMIPYDTVHKIVKLAGLNIDEAICFRDNFSWRI